MATVELTQIARNLDAVNVNGTILYFSYETCVAYRLEGDPRTVCCENVWSQSTGRHLNMIEPDEDKRFPKAEFDKYRDELEVL